MLIIKYRAVFFLASGLLVLASLAVLVVYGLKLGTDFTGGTIVEIQSPNQQFKSSLAALNLGQVSVQPIGEQAVLLRLRTLTEEEHQSLKSALGGVEIRYSSIGPAVGEELARKGLIAIMVVIALIILYIAFVFRHARPTGSSGRISRPISSWKYGLIAILALIHDVTIPTGVMVLLGRFYGVEADALFLTALLTILGLSVNDTIVVFDRIRENLKQLINESFEVVVGKSLNETIVRSINTSLTVVLVLLAVYFFGGASTKYFALVMAIGMVVGTYSSIFIASPLLVSWQKFSARVK